MQEWVDFSLGHSSTPYNGSNYGPAPALCFGVSYKRNPAEAGSKYKLWEVPSCTLDTPLNFGRFVAEYFLFARREPNGTGFGWLFR